MTTITIGLDGANWDMLSEWLDEGELPNLQSLIDGGIGGVSESCLPPLTVPNWKCYATGKNPGKLDVFRFDRIDTENRKHVFHDATDFKSAELWDYLNDEGMSAGVINKPSTYPVKEIDGFMVAGGPDASESEYRSLQEEFAYPQEVEELLREELDYQVHPTPMISPSEKGREEVDAVIDLIDMRFDAAELLLERYDPEFLHVTVFYSMALQHYFWTQEPVFRAWKRLDERLGRIKERIDEEDGNLLIMSDHGTCHVETVFYINAWLAEEGYLTVESSVDELFRKTGLTRERALAIAKKFNMVETLSEVVPEKIQKMVPWEEGIKRDRVLSVIDWDQTEVVASNQGPIYLNVDENDPRYEELRDELIEKLSSLKHPETGAPIVNAVYRGEEHYEGPYAENAPDLILDQGPNVHTSDAIGPDSWYASEGVWEGGNMPEGIFLWYGSNFRSEGITQEGRIVDLVPTLLHTMGAAVPDDLDGEVLDVFAPGSEPAGREVRYRAPIDGDRGGDAREREDVAERLADLGYLE